jgi:hypothetical protein
MSNNIEKTYNESTTYQGPQSWSELKQSGSQHYAGGMFRDFALCSIIKYALRNRNPEEPISAKDMGKIIDYVQKLIAMRYKNERARRIKRVSRAL